MIKHLICFLVLCLSYPLLYSQNIFTPNQESPKKEFDNIWTQKIYSDSLGTSILIWVKHSVPLHKHDHHTEHIYILEGTGDIKIGNDNYSVVVGDLVIIPKNTAHSLEVTSRETMKVISFQTPEFLGKDRVILKPNP